MLEDVTDDLQGHVDSTAARRPRFGWLAIARAYLAAVLLTYRLLGFFSGSNSQRSPAGAALRKITTDTGLTGSPAISVFKSLRTRSQRHALLRPPGRGASSPRKALSNTASIRLIVTRAHQTEMVPGNLTLSRGCSPFHGRPI